MMMVLPVFRCSASISSTASFPAAGSRFASGSSKSSISALSTKTPAMEIRCFWPPERSCGALPRCSGISTSAAASATRCRMSSGGTQSFSSAKAMSSAAESPTNWPSVSCKTVPAFLEISKMSRPRISSPKSVKAPENSPLKAWGMIPLIQWSSVDLPEPDGPRISSFSPRRRVKSISIRVGAVCARY